MLVMALLMMSLNISWSGNVMPLPLPLAARVYNEYKIDQSILGMDWHLGVPVHLISFPLRHNILNGQGWYRFGLLHAVFSILDDPVDVLDLPIGGHVLGFLADQFPHPGKLDCRLVV